MPTETHAPIDLHAAYNNRSSCYWDHTQGDKLRGMKPVVATMVAPGVVAKNGRAGREGGDAHTHYAIAEHYTCFTYTDSLQVTHVLCVYACN
jgi:hypothetical protein